MASLYTDLQISPKKKRYCSDDEDELTLSPKKLRVAPPTPPATASRKPVKFKSGPLPEHISRLCTIQSSLQQALSHALATSAGAPSSDTGVVRNVLNHLSLGNYNALATTFRMDDLKQLCWIWEWDGKMLPKPDGEEDNPFLDDAAPQQASPSKDWSRGGMGMVISLASHYSKSTGKREPAYGIGIQVDIDIDPSMSGGTAAVARWAGGSEARLRELRTKLDKWVALHIDEPSVPRVPLADLPALPKVQQTSALNVALSSASPNSRLSSPTKLVPPSSPSRSPSKSPFKLRTSATGEPTAIPFPLLTPRASAQNKSVSTVLFPQTPSRKGTNADVNASAASALLTPRTPATSLTKSEASEGSSVPSTPSRSGSSRPGTPTTARRQALLERVRLRSQSLSPKKTKYHEDGTAYTREQMLKVDREETRRRCLLGRLPGIAESVWMLFSASAPSMPGTPSSRSRKRKAIPMSEVVPVIVKSSPVPISAAEAQESIVMLTNLCPFFLKQMEVAGEDWVEMPEQSSSTGVYSSSASSSTTSMSSASRALAFASPSKRRVNPSVDLEATPTRPRTMSAKPTPKASSSKIPVKASVPSSPSRVKTSSASEKITGSPLRVGNGRGGLREVREIISRELELAE